MFWVVRHVYGDMRSLGSLSSGFRRISAIVENQMKQKCGKEKGKADGTYVNEGVDGDCNVAADTVLWTEEIMHFRQSLWGCGACRIEGCFFAGLRFRVSEFQVQRLGCLQVSRSALTI